MSRRTVIRIIVDLVLSIAVLQAWWFVAVPLVIVATWMYPFYIEGIIAGFAYDALFGTTGFRSHAGLLISILIFFIIFGTRRLVRK